MRTGLIAKKIGMSRIFNSSGVNIPVTVLQLDNCRILQKKTLENHGYNAVLVSFGKKKKNRVNKCDKGFFTKIKQEPSLRKKEFRVSKEGMLDIGFEITTDHFIVGQKVDVRGKTIGKGFAGGMKRHNFGGNRASHGVSISHRSHGSTGQCQDPGKVFKGKKMAGRLGGVNRTIQNLEVIKTIKNENLILVKGSVPGPKGLCVTIFDSIKSNKKIDLPYPTYVDESSNNNSAEGEISSPVNENLVDSKNESRDKKVSNLQNTETNNEPSSEKNDKFKAHVNTPKEGDDK